MEYVWKFMFDSSELETNSQAKTKCVHKDLVQHQLDILYSVLCVAFRVRLKCRRWKMGKTAAVKKANKLIQMMVIAQNSVQSRFHRLENQ